MSNTLEKLKKDAEVAREKRKTELDHLKQIKQHMSLEAQAKSR
jgi:hypothetical protein